MRSLLLNKIAKKEKELDCLYSELRDYVESLTKTQIKPTYLRNQIKSPMMAAIKSISAKMMKI